MFCMNKCCAIRFLGDISLWICTLTGESVTIWRDYSRKELSNVRGSNAAMPSSITYVPSLP